MHHTLCQVHHDLDWLPTKVIALHVRQCCGCCQTPVGNRAGFSRQLWPVGLTRTRLLTAAIGGIPKLGINGAARSNTSEHELHDPSSQDSSSHASIIGRLVHMQVLRLRRNALLDPTVPHVRDVLCLVNGNITDILPREAIHLHSRERPARVEMKLVVGITSCVHIKMSQCGTRD